MVDITIVHGGYNGIQNQFITGGGPSCTFWWTHEFRYVSCWFKFRLCFDEKHHIVWQSCGFDSFMTESLVNMPMLVVTEQFACVQCSLSNKYQHKSGH